MSGVHHPNLRSEWPEICRAPPVYARAVLHNSGANNALGERADGSRDLLVNPLDLGVTLGQRLGDLLFCPRLGLLALSLVGDGHGRSQLVGTQLGHRGLDLRGVVHLELVLHGGLDPGGGDQPALEAHRFFDPLLGPLQSLSEGGFVHFRGSVAVEFPACLGAVGLYHHDGHIAVIQNATGHYHFEGGFGALGIGGVGNPLPVGTVRHSHRADRTGERYARDAECCRCPVDGDHVIGVLLVGTQDGSDDMYLVAEPVGKRGPQRPVDQSTGQDGRLGGPTFPPEE